MEEQRPKLTPYLFVQVVLIVVIVLGLFSIAQGFVGLLLNWTSGYQMFDPLDLADYLIPGAWQVLIAYPLYIWIYGSKKTKKTK